MKAHIICFEGASLVDGFTIHPRLILVIPHRRYIKGNLNATDQAYLAIEKRRSIYGPIGIYTTEIWLDLENNRFNRNTLLISPLTEIEIVHHKNIEIAPELFRDLDRIEKNRNYNQQLINTNSKKMFDKIFPDDWIYLTTHRSIRKAKIFPTENCAV